MRPGQPQLAVTTSAPLVIVAKLFLVAHLIFCAAGCAHHAATAPAHSRPRRDRVPATTARTSTVSSIAADLRVVPASDLPKLDLAQHVGSYAAQDAAWVRGQPIVVNRDFDFATAFALDVGAGVAAAKRQKENGELAAKLASLDSIDSQALLQAQCASRQDACARFSGYSIRLFGLLYGQRAACLRVVLEFVDADGALVTPLYVAVSSARAIDEFEQSDVLRAAFALEIGHLIDLIALSSVGESDDRCATGDSTYVVGKRIDRDGSHIVLRASDPTSMLVRCNVEQ